jgi:DNA-binding XRE family transcriptional regulator
MANPALATSVRVHREALGLTREQFAREVDTSTSTIARIELTGYEPKLDVIRAIARRLQISIDELLSEQASA